jgi:hypothetical protein
MPQILAQKAQDRKKKTKGKRSKLMSVDAIGRVIVGSGHFTQASAHSAAMISGNLDRLSMGARNVVVGAQAGMRTYAAASASFDNFIEMCKHKSKDAAKEVAKERQVENLKKLGEAGLDIAEAYGWAAAGDIESAYGKVAEGAIKAGEVWWDNRKQQFGIQ